MTHAAAHPQAGGHVHVAEGIRPPQLDPVRVPSVGRHPFLSPVGVVCPVGATLRAGGPARDGSVGVGTRSARRGT